MAKRKYPSELNTRTIRVNISDWRAVNSLAQNLGVTVADALHKIITRDWAMGHRATRVKAPIAFPVKAPLAHRSRPITALATNGSKVAAFGIKPKGVRYA